MKVRYCNETAILIEKPLLSDTPKSQIIWGVLNASSNSNGVSDLKLGKLGVITLLLFGMVIGLTGIMCADQPVPAVPETQTLGTVTTADVVGIAMETDAGAWTLTNSGETMYTVTATSTSDVVKILNDDEIAQLLAAGGSVILVPGSDRTASISVPESLLNQLLVGSSWQTWAYILAIAVSDGGYVLTTAPGGIHNGVLSPAQIQYTTAYDANIVAQAGHTVLTKSMNINTGNKVLTQSNLKAQTGLTYIATSDGGNVVGSENLMIDGAGNTTKASDRMLCPFSSQPVDVIPAYCNIIQTGNTYDLTVGSVTSTMSERFVSSDATNPVQL